MGSIQRRRGPNVVGYLGLMQPLADGLKLFVKETVLPTTANQGIFTCTNDNFCFKSYGLGSNSIWRRRCFIRPKRRNFVPICGFFF